MMVWLVCFFVLFALAEFFDWVQELSLPLPIYILGGVLLAVASNYNKIVGSYFSNTNGEILPETPKLDSSAPISVTMLNSSEEVAKTQQE